MKNGSATIALVFSAALAGIDAQDNLSNIGNLRGKLHDLVVEGFYDLQGGFQGNLRSIIDMEATSAPDGKEFEDYSSEECPITFQQDEGSDDHCNYERKIITALQANPSKHPTTLVADGECRFDVNLGHHYIAECDGNSPDDLQFNFVRAFCTAGCFDCYEKDDLPDMVGIPSGRVYRSWHEKIVAICPVPKQYIEEGTEALVVHFSGNCLAASC